MGSEAFFSSIPQSILFVLFIISVYFIYLNNTPQVFRIVFEAIVTGYIFYWFVDVLPKFERNATNAKKVATELLPILEHINTLRFHVRDEIKASGQQFLDKHKFCDLLINMQNSHMPVTNNLRLIKGTARETPDQSINFIYSNLEEVMQFQATYLLNKIRVFERTVSIYNLSDLDPELMCRVNNLSERSPFSNHIKALTHIKNTPAVFGTEIDLIEDALVKIREKLEVSWRIKFN